MSVDLIARLRARRESRYDYATQGPEWQADPLCQEAADALEGALAEAAYNETRRQHWHSEACKENARAEAAEARIASVRADSVEECARVAEGEASYQAYCAAQTEEPASLPETLRMLEQWGPDALPANEKGQVPFARALMDAAADAIRAHLAKEAGR